MEMNDNADGPDEWQYAGAPIPPASAPDSFAAGMWVPALQSYPGDEMSWNRAALAAGLQPALPHFTADAGFVERATRYSSFGGGNLGGVVNAFVGLSPYSGGFTPADHPLRSGRQCDGENAAQMSTEHRDEAPEMSAGAGGSSSKDSDSKKRTRGDEMPADSANGSVQSKQKGKEMSPEETAASGKGSGKAQAKDGKEDYVHIRARRGQATNSHSLAERLRREKISERMKLLQDLVPGCSKVTGKAVMLDEIINYVQSLQRQVEFLSMKLAAVNPRIDLNIEGLLSKELLRFQAGASSSSMGCFPAEMMHPQLQLSQPGIVQGGMAGMPDPEVFRRAMQAQMNARNCGGGGADKDVAGLQMHGQWDAAGLQNGMQMQYPPPNIND